MQGDCSYTLVRLAAMLEILDKYVNDRGWVNLTVFRSKNGNTITRCTDPTSDAYKEKQMAKANSNAGQGGGQGDDLPF